MMPRYEEIVQLKAFARIDGALLALLWIVGFLAVIYMPASIVGNLLVLSTPFFVGWRLCRFRDYARDGIISTRRGFVYSFYTFVYGTLLFGLAQFVYLRFIDGGAFLSLLTETINAMIPLYEKNGLSTKEIKETMDMMSMLSPIQWAVMFMLQSFMAGLLLSLPIAAVCSRRFRVGR